MINDHSERLFLSGDVAGSLKKSCNELKQKKYLKSNILDRSLDAVSDEINQDYFESVKRADRHDQFIEKIPSEAVVGWVDFIVNTMELSILLGIVGLIFIVSDLKISTCTLASATGL